MYHKIFIKLIMLIFLKTKFYLHRNIIFDLSFYDTNLLNTNTKNKSYIYTTILIKYS